MPAGRPAVIGDATSLCNKLVSLTTSIRLTPMSASGRRLGWLGLLLALATWLGAGCASDSGSKEFIPGKGWRSTAVESGPARGG